MPAFYFGRELKNAAAEGGGEESLTQRRRGRRGDAEKLKFGHYTWRLGGVMEAAGDDDGVVESGKDDEGADSIG